MCAFSRQTGRSHEMPVLQAVVGHTTIEWIMEASIFLLEVTIAVIVGLLIGRYVTNDHVELRKEGREGERENMI